VELPIPVTIKHELYSLTQSTVSGINPLTAGFIVCVKDKRSKVELRPREDELPLPDTAGHVRIFNHTYKSARDVVGQVTVWDSKMKKESHLFKIIIEENNTRRLISNFFMTKAGGQTTEGASGLDVAFCIACSKYIYGTKWEFGDPDDKKPQFSLGTSEISTHHIYKTQSKEGWKGNVSVYDSKKGMEEDKAADSREFNVIMADLCDCTSN
jgi:hypothetical protein